MNISYSKMLSLYYPLMTSFISQTVTTKPVVKDFKYYGDIAPTGFFEEIKTLFKDM